MIWSHCKTAWEGVLPSAPHTVTLMANTAPEMTWGEGEFLLPHWCEQGGSECSTFSTASPGGMWNTALSKEYSNTEGRHGSLQVGFHKNLYSSPVKTSRDENVQWGLRELGLYRKGRGWGRATGPITWGFGVEQRGRANGVQSICIGSRSTVGEIFLSPFLGGFCLQGIAVGLGIKDFHPGESYGLNLLPPHVGK